MLSNYLMFNRNCEDALNTYKTAFGAEILEMKKYSDMPPNPAFPIPEEDMGLVLNSRIVIDGMEIMCADSSARSKSGSNMYISITSSTEAVQKAWEVLKDNAEIYMELTPSFFSPLHGSLQDKFGVNWMFTAIANQ